MRHGLLSDGGSPASRSRLWLLCATGLLIVLGFCGLGAYMLAELRQDTLTLTTRTSENLLTAVSEDIERNVELFDLSLQAVIDGLELPGMDALTPAMRKAVLFDRAATARYLGAIIVLDAAGNVVEDSGATPPRRANLSDRDYFIAHAAGFRGLYVSRPFRRRVTGAADLVIALSRPLRRADGSFAGVVVGTLRLDYLKDLFSRFQLGEQGVVSLLRDDGTMVMRTPYAEEMIGKDLSGSDIFRRLMGPEGRSVTATASLDGVRRIYNHRHVGSLPLTVSIGLSEAEIYAGWWQRAVVIGGVLAALFVGAASLAVLLARELRRRTRAEAVMRASEAQYRLLANHATDVIIRLDAGLNRQYVSPASLAVLGYPPSELVGTPLIDFIHPADWPDVLRLLREVQDSQGTVAATYRFRHRDGHWVWVEANCNYMPSDGGLAVVLRDITLRKQAEQQLEAVNCELSRLAVTDKLTGLLNRRGFDDAFKAEWVDAVRNATPLSLVLVDVDRFKMFNDRYGHLRGDHCLRALGGVIADTAKRQGDIAARYGGEELALLFPNADEAGAAGIAESLRAAIARLAIDHAENVEGHGVVTVSIGVASINPRLGETFPSMQDLISAADAALYQAKRTGRNKVVRASRPRKVEAKPEPEPQPA